MEFLNFFSDSQNRSAIRNRLYDEILKNNDVYLKKYYLNKIWKQFEVSFQDLGINFNLQDTFSFKLCPNESELFGSLNPRTQKIGLCANLIDNEDDFDQQANYYITKLYDLNRADISHPNCEEMACMDIRALHISGICSDDPACYEENLQKNVFDRHEICLGRGKTVFPKVYDTCFSDISPLNKFGSSLN